MSAELDTSGKFPADEVFCGNEVGEPSGNAKFEYTLDKIGSAAVCETCGGGAATGLFEDKNENEAVTSAGFLGGMLVPGFEAGCGAFPKVELFVSAAVDLITNALALLALCCGFKPSDSGKSVADEPGELFSNEAFSDKPLSDEFSELCAAARDEANPYKTGCCETWAPVAAAGNAEDPLGLAGRIEITASAFAREGSCAFMHSTRQDTSAFARRTERRKRSEFKPFQNLPKREEKDAEPQRRRNRQSVSSRRQTLAAV